MRNTVRLLLAAFLLCTATLLWAGNGKPAVGATPGWVKPFAVNYSATALDNDAQDGYADLNYERQINLAQQAEYVRKTVRVLSESGLENLSQIEVDYDPSFEQVIFHTVRILRNGQIINQLKASHIETIRQEKERDRSIYNGQLTALLIVEDLRKDDVLDYSYTVKGFNPIFKNKYTGTFFAGFAFPFYNVHYRLLVPNGRSVQTANTVTAVQPAVSQTPSETAYEWNFQNLRPVEVEKSVPSWYDAYPAIQVSEYKSWKEVADWALEIFSFSAPLSAGLQQKVDEIKTGNSSGEDRVRAALRFVQDEVRYLGIEMGENSHRPHAPAQVLQQRFGDCKDKAYLLCTLLRALNVEAYPVLINTDSKKTLNSWLPSPTAFDHTTVCVPLNGKTYWFDATISYQRGPLQAISFPDYQTGLVVKPGTTGLTAIPLQDNGKTATREVFTVSRMSGPASLMVETKFSGSYADEVRRNYHSKSNKEIQGDYKKFYGAYFKKLDADSLGFEDDEQTGLFTTKEYYTVHDFWKEENGSRKALFEPYLINSVIRKPDDENRRMPFALSYPVRYEEEIEVHLPEEWSADKSSEQFKTEAFYFGYDYSHPQPDVMRLRYSYENLQDHVSPEAITDYNRTWKEAEEGMAFSVTSGYQNGSRPANKSTPMSRNDGFTLAYVLLGCLVLFTYLYRRNSRRSY